MMRKVYRGWRMNSVAGGLLDQISDEAWKEEPTGIDAAR
jgi:hypothetical protein